MLRQQVVALVAHEARGECRALEGGTFDDVAVAVMRKARAHFMAPTEDEAFAASLGALLEAFPDVPVLEEARAIGERSKLMAALTGGVPVDMDAVVLAPFPEPPLDLIGLWEQSA